MFGHRNSSMYMLSSPGTCCNWNVSHSMVRYILCYIYSDEDTTESKRRASAIAETVIKHEKLTFNDVAGLSEAKHTLREAIIMPLQYPHLFTGISKFLRQLVIKTFSWTQSGWRYILTQDVGNHGNEFCCTVHQGRASLDWQTRWPLKSRRRFIAYPAQIWCQAGSAKVKSDSLQFPSL